MLGPRDGQRHEAPACQPKPAAQVKVFAVEEISLVEAADVLEGTSSDEQCRGGQALHVGRTVGYPLGVIGKSGHATEEAAGQWEPKKAAGAQRTAEEVQRTQLDSLAPLRLARRSIPNHALNRRDLRIRFEDRNGGAYRRRVDGGIRIHEEDIVPRCPSDAAVLATSVARVRHIA